MSKGNGQTPRQTVGLDLGDRFSELCVLDQDGDIVERGKVRTTKGPLEQRFAGLERVRIVLEVGTHSPWISRLLTELGHEVVVANPRKLRLIYENPRKTDRADAEYLGRVGRLDPELLAPVEHRGRQAQADLAMLKAQDQLVKARAQLINHMRGAVKSWGERLPKCSTPAFARKVSEAIPEALRPALDPLLAQIQRLTDQIREYDKQIRRLSEERYAETELLKQVAGVGTKTALGYVLTIEDPARFRRSRMVGPYLGLVPRQDDSGDRERRGRITKHGDDMCRWLLVQSAHYIMGPLGPDCDLRRWGKQLMERGDEQSRKHAVVAVARKLSVLLHRLWVTGEEYEPLRNAGDEKKLGPEAVPA